MTVFYVALGGALGAVLRYFAALSFSFPYATLFVNVLGSLAMGVAFAVLSQKGLDRWMPFVMTGLLGGFTTYSAFSLDAVRLFEAGQLGGAMAYVLGTVLLCVLACFAGIAMGKGFIG